MAVQEQFVDYWRIHDRDYCSGEEEPAFHLKPEALVAVGTRLVRLVIL